GKSQLLRLDHQVDYIRLDRRAAGEVEAFEQQQLFKQDVALRDRRLLVHGQSTVFAGDGSADLGPMRRQIVGRKVAALFARDAQQRLDEGAAVERGASDRDR